MSKIAQKIKNAVAKQSWDDICLIYYTITGEKISPPATQVTVDPKLMSKRQIYSYLKNDLKLNFLSQMKDYDLKDLMLIYQEHSEEQKSTDSTSNNAQEVEVVYTENNGEPEYDNVNINISPQPQYTFISKSKASKILNGDKQPIQMTLRDFPSYGDEGKSNIIRARKRNLVNARCRVCNKNSQVSPHVIIRGTENERTYICEGCG